jgi:signal transduction histidine kinase
VQLSVRAYMLRRPSGPIDPRRFLALSLPEYKKMPFMTGPSYSQAQFGASNDSALVTYLQSSAETEKAELARELHDDLGGLLVGALMDVAWAEGQTDIGPQSLAKLQRARQSLRSAVELKRKLIENVRPTLLDNVGLFGALRWHLKQMCEGSNYSCVSTFPEMELTLSPDRGIALFRIIQEALQLITQQLNARQMNLAVAVEHSALHLKISHDGIAGETDELRDAPVFASMRHRITVVAGTIEIHTGKQPAQWCIAIPLPAVSA